VFFKKHGYIEFAKQNSYYRNIERYTYSHLIEELIQSLKKNKIEISLYDQEKHHGFQELFDDLKNSYWQTEITQAVQDKKPVLVASHDGKIIGFTGPLRVQPSLRGYFAGIGVHQEYRGLGVGKVLFAALCKELSRLGAHYMSLFTGENNQARKIYERENFVIVRSWANMRKDINHA
jgi:GNAT superfamily N-acetyltransferase